MAGAEFPPLAGVALDRPRLMGVVNVTPDSFHDGGRYVASEAAMAKARRLAAEGADFIDIGGESSRPGGQAVTLEQELDRIVPVFEGLADLGVPLSIDSRRAPVMAAALERGAAIVNDISALADEAALELMAGSDVPIILMHCPPDFAAMHAGQDYQDIGAELAAWLAVRIARCEAAGIARARLVVDPGIGFAKNAAQSAAALSDVARLHELGCPVLVGASRKSFIGHLADVCETADRLPGSLAAALWAVSQGVHVLRVHDVAETRQALEIWPG
ncbi:MAG TPA: dihydropteroate synthase [Alphaproteobacteria bacterium]|jgi:dihydropteroate synthase|nr:dihydropteroate synthase [Alphaproteobacteria bacterium]MDP6270201.1 dihydropteroate synthase [Alphaproteobacteria bacterium]MDP7164373.1 dihydropteroate synthase [Alphaproteobacteria bacterium]MDP7428801.1 dihydropteroate synthase [Alphaproteobacteria bacterium]HJM50422.1 dihydropteroate synthase [Alphaproteobacteria bacterium]